MVQFFEFGWLFWWFLAIVVILRWLHINRLPYDSSSDDETRDMQFPAAPPRSNRKSSERITA